MAIAVLGLGPQACEPGALDTKAKELLGLVVALRQLHYLPPGALEVGWSRSQVIDALNVALVVGSITVLHVRRAFARMKEIPGLHPEVK